MKWLAAAMLVIPAALLAACEHRSRVTSCQSDLQGVWRTETAARWMILDLGPASLEVYPLFTDGGSSHGVIAAPRVIDLHREGGGLAGTITKRFIHGADPCEAHASVEVTSCADDTLEVELGDVGQPQTMTPCTWPPTGPSHVEHWRHE